MAPFKFPSTSTSVYMSSKIFYFTFERHCEMLTFLSPVSSNMKIYIYLSFFQGHSVIFMSKKFPFCMENDSFIGGHKSSFLTWGFVTIAAGSVEIERPLLHVVLASSGSFTKNSIAGLYSSST